MSIAKLEDVKRFTSLFRGRTDAFGVMQEGRIVAVRRSVSLLHYRLHLEGKIRLGIYPLLPKGLTHFLALDFDGHRAHEWAFEVFSHSRHFDLPLAWEVSKSRGVHLWLFFPEPAPARDVRLVARMLLDESGVQAEIFPKQDAVPEDGLGNFIWLPLSGESLKHGKTCFLDTATFTTCRDQHDYLSSIRKVSARRMTEIVSMNGLRQKSRAYLQGDARRKSLRVFQEDFLPCAKRMFQGVEEGYRDVAAFRLAIHLKSRGFSLDQAEEFLQRWNAEQNGSPLESHIITTKARSAYRHGYTGYGCEDPLIIPFCEESCPIKQKTLNGLLVAEEDQS